MKISLLCTSADHPINSSLREWADLQHREHEVVICRDKKNLPGGDLLFLVSCSQLIDKVTRSLYRHTLVLHASDLPKGRGWSPHVWDLLKGAKSITVSLLDAEDEVDAGAIWAKQSVPIPPHALYDEINKMLFETEISLMSEAVVSINDTMHPVPQDPIVDPTYYRKRTPADSEIDPSLSLQALFNKIRLMDPERYPAYFHIHGERYTIELKKVLSDDKDHD